MTSDVEKARALHLQGAALIQQSRFDEARICLEQALQLLPDNADLHATLGNVFAHQEYYDEAISAYQHALRLDPNHFGANFILAIALHDKGRLDESVVHYRQALKVNSQHAEAHNGLGGTLLKQGKLAEAAASFRQALQVNPKFFEACCNLGIVLNKQDQLDAAISCFQQAIRLHPYRAEAYHSLAIVLERQKNFEEASHYYSEAIRLDPNYLDPCINLGNLLKVLGRLDDALLWCQKTARVKPDNAEIQTNLGNVLADLGRFDEAHACFDRAIDLNPELVGPHHNRALAWLLEGNWSQGWPEYEWRWQTPEFPRYTSQQPRWDRSPLAGRKLLLLAEQGLGDTLQFIRYVPLIQDAGCVLLQCQPPLQCLLSACFGAAQLTVQGNPIPEFDVYAPLLSLPGIMGTTLSNVPAAVPYIQADAGLVEHWRHEIENLTPGVQGFKVGIAWQGNPTFHRDLQRSVPLARFAPLAALPGIQLISLQKGPGTEQLPVLAKQFRIVDFGSRLDATSGPFMDTAAIMMSLDLVISSDTVIPHLAGALGIPVWVALPTVPDWRWLLEREDSPWYPTMRLFRQNRASDWDEVFERIATELMALAAGRG